MFARLSRKTGEFIKISNCVNYTSPPPPEPFCCHETDHCEGCRYPSTGFICWHADGTCMRTDAEKIRERQRKERDARLRSQHEVQIVSAVLLAPRGSAVMKEENLCSSKQS